MTDKPLAIIDLLQDQNEAPTLAVTGGVSTETIDLDGLQLYSPTHAANTAQEIKSSAVGKLLQIVPIPTLLVDRSGTVILGNRACTGAGGGQSGIEGEQVSRVFGRNSTLDLASILVQEVFATRKPGAADGEFDIGGTKINGRLHARPTKVGGQSYALLMLESLAANSAEPYENEKNSQPKIQSEPKTKRPLGVPAVAYFSDGVLTWANAAFVFLFKAVKQDALIGKSTRDFFSSREEFQALETAVTENSHLGQTAGGDAVFRCLDGTCFSGHVKIAPIDFKSPEKGITFAISKNPDRSPSLKPLPEPLAAESGGWTADLATSTLESCPLGIVVCDKEGQIASMNAKAVEALGTSVSESMSGLNLLTFPPFLESGLAGVVRKCLNTREVVVSEFPHKIGLGKRFHSRAHAAPIRDAQGALIGAQVLIENVTDQKNAEKQLLMMERLKAVGEMSGSMANNFNSIMQLVAGGSRKALHYLESRNTGQVRELLDSIFEGSRQAVVTLKRLQQFSRARQGLGFSRFSRAQREVFDLADAVKVALDKSKASSEVVREKQGVSVSLANAGGCLVDGEQTEMIETVVNLINNAVEAMPLGGKIEVETFVKKEKAYLLVRDNGVGIPERNLGRIFEPFWTTKDSHTGMGLTANFGIVRRHQGTISVTTTEGRGTIFTIKLPLAVKTQFDAVDVAKKPLSQGFRILLIDDDAPIVGIFDKGLRKAGHITVTAGSGQQGIRVFEEEPVDAVVCDLAMPEMNGWEVARSIHNISLEKGIPKPPFILVTGWAGQISEEEMAAHPDVDRIVEKPVKVTRLIEIVTKEIQSRMEDPSFTGRVEDLGLLEFLQVVLMSGKSMIVEVRLKNGLRGFTYLKNGKICHARCGDLEGEEALYRCIAHPSVSFSNLPWNEPESITINKSSEYLLFEASRLRDELK